jgi:hypothetical protein
MAALTRHFDRYERKDLARLLRGLALAPAPDDVARALVDGEDPAPRLAADFAALSKAGWELS